ncbi:hypothetical protein TNCT_401171 [Trichonephila clavata]|uniref:Uncharacterized protein n=1 Tax=Trichonephila clavata TaxID=2740835 RepID=A0A8X6JJC5_TRICU|nr:hypothetical protein TNCT_401171 [Trichonephila clavata]
MVLTRVHRQYFMNAIKCVVQVDLFYQNDPMVSGRIGPPDSLKFSKVEEKLLHIISTDPSQAYSLGKTVRPHLTLFWLNTLLFELWDSRNRSHPNAADPEEALGASTLELR